MHFTNHWYIYEILLEEFVFHRWIGRALEALKEIERGEDQAWINHHKSGKQASFLFLFHFLEKLIVCKCLSKLVTPETLGYKGALSWTTIYGPNPSITLSGYEYYFTFIDDYSRNTWIYLLKTKDEVFRKFKEFKALIENHSERRIKILITNNGGEYTSKYFESFCKEDGIKRELTTPYNSQHNLLQKERIGQLWKKRIQW